MPLRANAAQRLQERSVPIIGPVETNDRASGRPVGGPCPRDRRHLLPPAGGRDPARAVPDFAPAVDQHQPDPKINSRERPDVRAQHDRDLELGQVTGELVAPGASRGLGTSPDNSQEARPRSAVSDPDDPRFS